MMKRFVLLAAATLLGLAGCATQQAEIEGTAEYNRDYADCQESASQTLAAQGLEGDVDAESREIDYCMENRYGWTLLDAE